MIVPISIQTASDTKLPSGLVKISHDEVILVELQGALEVECNHDSERDGKLVGKLKIDENTTRPTLSIGHHLLEGKIATLPKPLAVLLRSQFDPRHHAPPFTVNHDLDEDGGAMDVQDLGFDKPAQTTVGWDVVAVVKRKIVFSNRPMPIVGRQMATA